MYDGELAAPAAPSLTGGSIPRIPERRTSFIGDSLIGAPPRPPGSTGAPADALQAPSAYISQPNPLASSVGRDAIMTYAHRLYQDLGAGSNPSRYIVSAVPIFDVVQNMTSPGDQLVSLLNTLRSLHPQHLPILLLLASVHYAQGNYVASLRLNNEIMKIEPQYVISFRSSVCDIIDYSPLIFQVEAMCNTGTIMKRLDRPSLAYDWWWRALQIQPTYWEVTVCPYYSPK